MKKKKPCHYLAQEETRFNKCVVVSKGNHIMWNKGHLFLNKDRKKS